jgi:hypothetical protein
MIDCWALTLVTLTGQILLQEGEERARETIETLNTEIQNLTKVFIVIVIS